MDFAKTIVREILRFVGPSAETSYPTLARHWGILKQRSRQGNNVAFEVLKTLIHFSKSQKGLTLLDVIFGGKSLKYRFDKVRIQFGPTWYRNGNVTIAGEQAYVLNLHFDLTKLKKLNYPSRQIKKFNGHSETRDYETLKDWDES